MGEAVGDLSTSSMDEMEGDEKPGLFQKDTDATVGTECSSDEHDSPQCGQDSIHEFGEGLLPEDDDLNSSTFSAFNASSDLPDVAKEEVRRSILKGKSELSKSRQKNNILKAMPVEGASSLHKPHNASSSKEHHHHRKPPKFSRSLSNDDITGINTSAADAKSGKRLHGSKNIGEGEKPKALGRRGSVSNPLPPVSGELPQFCTPRRPAGNKVLKVDTTAMLDLATSFDGPSSRRTPGRSKSAATQRKKPHGLKRTPSFDASKSSGHAPRRKCKSFNSDQSSEEINAATSSDEKETSSSKLDADVTKSDYYPPPNEEPTTTESSQSKLEEGLVQESDSESPKAKSAQQSVTEKEDATDQSVSKSARQSTHTATSSHAPAEEEMVLMWSCWACEYESNVAEHLFCGMCGTGRDWACPSCEHDNKSSFNFCGMCGTRKGRVVLNKQQPEAFDMRMHKKTGKRLPKKTSSNRSRASKAPDSVASGRRSSGRHKLLVDELIPPPDDESAASDQKSYARSTSGGDNGEKRSRGRGHESMKKSHRRDESVTRGESVTRKKVERTRSGTVERRDGKDRPKRNSFIGEDETKPSRKSFVGEDELRTSRKEKPKRRPRRSRDGDSPHDEENDGDQPWDPWDLKASKSNPEVEAAPAAESPTLKRSNSAPKLELAGNIKESVDNSLGGNGKFNPDLLATPSIKKRLLKIGKGAGKMLFNKQDMIAEEEPIENRIGEIKIKRTESGELLDSMHVQKQVLEPPTPSLKKRLLGKVGLSSKSKHSDKLPGPPTLSETQADESESVVDIVQEEEEEDEDYDPLVGFNQGLVITAKDMRPNRPQVSRRKPPNAQQRRKSSHDGRREEGRRDDGRDGHRSSKDRPKRTTSGSRPMTHKDAPRRGSSYDMDDPAGDMDISEADSIESI